MATPSLVLVEPDATERLRAVDALRARWDVHPLGARDEPLRAVRRLRPAIVVVSAGRSGTGALHLCRAIRTERTLDARVLVVNREAVAAVRRFVRAGGVADGYLEGPVSTEVLVDACSRLAAGQEVDEGVPVEPKGMRAWLRSLTRR